MTIPDPYGHSIFRGKLLDNATIAALKIAEARLGYELTILQGIGGAKASAGTHVDGRMVDLAEWDAENKLRVLKNIGFIGWHREYRPGVWAGHLHVGLIFEFRENRRGIADSGFRQIAMYDARRDGLVSNLEDDSHRPVPPAVFTMAEYRATFEKPEPKPVRNKITRARDRLVESTQTVSQAIALLDDADPKRVKAHAEIDDLKAVRKQINATLDRLPKR
ncbi:hypothetical protein [Nocardioides sp. SYSU DS0663]|uniref:hypothetical protein n=1 Tax=Nocardioides sp. SYSU DS0663 TaxID=3416445 RepID=UPI003F4BBF93